MRIMLKSKIHRATITDCNIDYEGSITIDRKLMEEADILAYEQVQVLDINNGSRFTTYAIEGGPGEIGQRDQGGGARRRTQVAVDAHDRARQRGNEGGSGEMGILVELGLFQVELGLGDGRLGRRDLVIGWPG